MIVTGVSVSFVVGTFITWRDLALVGKAYNTTHCSYICVAYNLCRKNSPVRTVAGIVPCAVLLVGLSVIPESPRWLVSTISRLRLL